MKIITKEEEDKLGLLQIVETYTNRDKTLMRNLIVWTPHMHQEEIDYYRSNVPEGFSLYNLMTYGIGKMIILIVHQYTWETTPNDKDN